MNNVNQELQHQLEVMQLRKSIIIFMHYQESMSLQQMLLKWKESWMRLKQLQENALII